MLINWVRCTRAENLEEKGADYGNSMSESSTLFLAILL